MGWLILAVTFAPILSFHYAEHLEGVRREEIRRAERDKRWKRNNEQIIKRVLERTRRS